MFRRHWSGLPSDVRFPSDLNGLGYFVNENDEIRSIENPDCYFKYFLNRNPRINNRQRFEFNHATEEIVHERLERTRGMQRTTLPLGTLPTQPHVPVFISKNISDNPRVVVLFGECSKDLGILAWRVVNGPGGIARGSMLSVVDALHKQASSPAVVLANMGQLYWWPPGGRAITVSGSAAVPLPSLVHAGYRYCPEVNDIPRNKDPAKHVSCVFDDVLGKLVDEDAVIDVVAIGDSCEIVERFLDDEHNWAIWGSRLGSMVLLGPVYTVDGLSNQDLKRFLAERARGYLVSEEPVDTPLAPPEGNLDTGIPAFGFPCFSSSEPQHVELILIEALAQVLSYLEAVSLDPAFENPIITMAPRPEEDFVEEDEWDKIPESQKPEISTVDMAAVRRMAPDTDSDRTSHEFVIC